MTPVLRAWLALASSFLLLTGCPDPGCPGFYAECVKQLPLGSSVEKRGLVPEPNFRFVCGGLGRFFAIHPEWNCGSSGVCAMDGGYRPECGEYLVRPGSSLNFNCGAFVQDGGVVAVYAFCAD